MLVILVFKVFFTFLKKHRANPNIFAKPHIPYYIKDEYFPLLIPRIKIKDGSFAIPMSVDFKRKFGLLTIKIPPFLLNEKIKEVEFELAYLEMKWMYE